MPGSGAKYFFAPAISSSAAFGLTGSVQKITTCENMGRTVRGEGRGVKGKVRFALVIRRILPSKEPMPDWIAVVILGIVEGVTEFIPVSSTGHLLIAEQWLPRQTDLFNIVIQSGAVLAVLPLFSLRCQQLVFRWREAETRAYLLKLFLAFGLTGAVGFVLEKGGFRLKENPRPIAGALLIGGILF